MAKIAGAIFGVPDLPSQAPEEKPERTEIDPHREAELAAAAKRRRSIFSRRGRSFLRQGGQTKGGVSFGGGAAKPGAE